MPYTIAALLVSSASDSLAAQEEAAPFQSPTQDFLVAGYGTAGWSAERDGGSNAFFASFSPLLLFHFGDRFLFETELEFEVDDGVTETGLEYAQVDFFVNDNVTLVAGKFLVPFGVFGERLHPTWINRFATNPPIFGHGEGALPSLLPILADFGAMARGSWALGGGRSLVASAFVTQGPFAEADHGEGEEEAPDPEVGAAPRLEFEFGEETVDVTGDKMVGGRVGWVLAPTFELDVSGLTGEFDDEGSRLNALNLAAEFRRGPTELRAEAVGLWYDVEVEEEEGEQEGEPTGEEEAHGESVTARTGGFYAQMSRRIGRWEPAVRWTQAFDVDADHLATTEGYRQLAFGLDYWFSPAIALMGVYEVNGIDSDLPDRFVVHWSFGF